MTIEWQIREASRGFNFLKVMDPVKVDRVKMAKHVKGIVMTQLEPENQLKRIYY